MKIIGSWVIVAVLLVGAGAWLLGGTPSTQAQTGDTDGDLLLVHDFLDLSVLQSILTYPDTASYIQDALVETHACALTLQWQPGPVAGDRDYYFTMRFPQTGLTTDSLLAVSYAHEGSTGGSPALSPDSCVYEFVRGVPRTKASSSIIPDIATYDFLVHVLTQESRVLWSVARGATISGLRVEENERPSGGPEYLVHMEVTRGRNVSVVTLASKVGRGGAFSRLVIRRD